MRCISDKLYTPVKPTILQSKAFNVNLYVPTVSDALSSDAAAATSLNCYKISLKN